MLIFFQLHLLNLEHDLKFADEFEDKFIRQSKDEDRSIQETLDLGWKLLSILPKTELKRVKDQYVEQYLPQSETEE